MEARYGEGHLREQQAREAAAGRAWLGEDRVEARKAELSFGNDTVVSERGFAAPSRITAADALIASDPARAYWDVIKTDYT